MADEKVSLELGRFEVRSVEDDGSEVRLASERKGSNLVLRDKSVGKGLKRGDWLVLSASVEEAPSEQVATVEIPASRIGELPVDVKVVEPGKKKGK